MRVGRREKRRQEGGGREEISEGWKEGEKKAGGRYVRVGRREKRRQEGGER